MFRVIYETGSLCHQALDISIDGIIPCEFGRLYRSASTTKGPLGHGWHWPWDINVSFENDQFVYRSSGGLVEEYFSLKDAHNALIRSKGGSLQLLASGRLLISLNGGWMYEFPNPSPLQPIVPLEAILDRNGNVCRCINKRGILEGIVDANGRSYRILRDLEGRITAVELDGGVPTFPRRLFTYQYDRSGDLVRIIDRCGSASEYEYDHHLMVGFRNRTGGWHYADYDSSRRCIRTWRSDGRLAKTYLHDAVKDQVLSRDASGYGTLFRVNKSGALVQKVDSMGQTTTMVYGPEGGLVATLSSSGLSSTVTVLQDSNTSETQMCGADGSRYTVRTDKETRQEISTDPAGGKWTRTFDSAGNLIEVKSPMGAVYSYHFDPRGQISSVATPGGNTTRYSYSADYQTLQVSDELGAVGEFVWNEEGLLIRRQMPECNSEFYNYDALGRMTEIIRPNGGILTLRLDAEGNCISVITETGETRDAEWSLFGELISGLDPLGIRFRNDYDELCRVVSIRNGLGEVLSREYDGVGRLISQTFFDGRSERYAYDPRGFLASIAYDDGSVERLTFDDSGRINEVDDGVHQLRLKYDSRGLLGSIDKDDVKVQYIYDAEGRPTLETQDGVPISRVFDPAGNCVSLSVEGLGTRTFQYDARHRVVRVADFNGDQIEIDYDQRDRCRSITVSSDVALEWAYFPENRIRRVRLRNLVESREVAYQYDRSGRIVEREGLGLETASFDYLPEGYLGRMAINNQGQDQRYTITGDSIQDAAGETIEYSIGGRVASAGDTFYEFDSRGRMVTISSPVRTLKLTYDNHNFLVSLKSDAEGETTYRYDGLARRVGKTKSGNETKFLWDGDCLLAEIVPKQNQTRTYLGTAWRVFLISSLREGDAKLILSDLNGLPLALATSKGLAISTGSTVWGKKPAPPDSTPLRLAGQYADDESGLVYNHNRYYDPRLLRYITPDPIGLYGSINAYAYQTDPVNNVDPHGLATVTAHNCPPGTPSPKPQPPTTIAADPGCSRGSSVHNDCITKARDRARAAGYQTRADQSMTSGTGSNRPDLSLSMPGQQNVHIEWDNPPAARAAGHLADICAADPGAVVFLVTLNVRYGAAGGPSAAPTSQGARTANSKMGKGTTLSDSDCGIDDINSDMTSRGMVNL